MSAEPVLIEQEIVSEGRDLTFGQYLRRERILRGISSEEIIRVTKVSPEYYHALENNIFDPLPHKAFVVGFLRVLSKYAGLDSDELVNRFLAQSSVSKDVDTQVDAFPSFMRRHWKKVCFTFGALGLLVLMFLPLL